MKCHQTDEDDATGQEEEGWIGIKNCQYRSLLSPLRRIVLPPEEEGKQ